MITDFASLQPGQPCFVEIFNDVYAGVVAHQQTWDRTTRVETAAARFVHRAWKGMSFQWKDGRGYACKSAVLLVPTTQTEQYNCERRAKKTACGFSQELGLFTKEAAGLEPAV